MSINIKLDAVCDGQHKHPTITEDGLVTDINSICCLQPQEISAYVKSPRSILVPETETIRFEEKLLWVGLVNGEKGIGVMKEHDSTSLYHNDQDKFCKTTDLKYFLPLFKVQLILLKEMKNYINYDEIGIKIFNPIKITKIEIDDKINKLIKIHKYGSDNFVRVKDKVSVNDISCLCCIDLIGINKKMPDETRINGMFYVPVNEIKSCFKSDGPQNHFQLKIADSGVKYESVCCIEVMDQLVGYPWIRVDVELIKGDKNYKCKWIGKMNGEDIVGIETDTNLWDMNKMLSNLVVPGNEKLIFYQASTFKYGIRKCESLRCNIIDPTVHINLRAINRVEDNKISYVFVGNDRRRGVVKWVGNINGNEIVACEMDINRGSGIFGGFLFFNQADKREVMLVQDDNLTCCEVDGRHNDVVIERNGRLDKDCFCCLQSKDKIERYDKVEVGQRFTWNNGDGWTVVRCVWIGVINGFTECGQFLSDLSPRRNNRELYICLNYINPDNIICDVTKLLIVKPDSVKSIDNEEIIDKYLVITTKNMRELTIKAKWKGSINENFVIGCELSMASNYGSAGRFAEHKLFNCDNGRGILMVLDGYIRTCANGSHKDIDIYPNIMIKEQSICCIEYVEWRTSKLTNGMRVSLIVNSKIKGTCKWVGNINGQPCVGLETNQRLKYACNGRLAKIELFHCSRGHGYITRIENVTIL